MVAVCGFLQTCHDIESYNCQTVADREALFEELVVAVVCQVLSKIPMVAAVCLDASWVVEAPRATAH
jgi:hypothetical protein